MQIVIDIPEDAWDEIKNGSFEDSWNYTVFHLLEWASRGTPLPKGHGRLIDADKLESCTRYYAPRGFEGMLMRYADLHDAPTIIEADKEADE